MGGMKAIVKITQKNLRENSELILCDSVCELDIHENTYSFHYNEKKPLDGKVMMKGNNHGCSIYRKAEGTTTLVLEESKTTKGSVESIYGTFDLEIYTHQYIWKNELIAVKYDILNQGEIIESYRLMIKIKPIN